MNFEPNYSSIVHSWIALVSGLVMLTGGGEFLVAGAAKLAKRLGMSSLLIGLTVVAFGTSMPELFVGLIALFQGHPDILTGNVIGSNIANIGLILGICALITPLTVRFKSVSLELIIVLFASILVFISAWQGIFPRTLGFIFLVSLLLYTARSFKQAVSQNAGKKKKTPGTQPQKEDHLPAVLAVTVFGLGCLPVGSNFFIKGAVDVALHFGVSELVIGLTLAAVGTSLPELASCLAAIRQRQTEILAGNIIGSNLFNLLMVLGLCGALSPFSLSASLFARDIPIMFSFSVALLAILIIRQGLRRRHGFVLLAAYCVYLYALQ